MGNCLRGLLEYQLLPRSSNKDTNKLLATVAKNERIAQLTVDANRRYQNYLDAIKERYIAAVVKIREPTAFDKEHIRYIYQRRAQSDVTIKASQKLLDSCNGYRMQLAESYSLTTVDELAEMDKQMAIVQKRQPTLDVLKKKVQTIAINAEKSQFIREERKEIIEMATDATKQTEVELEEVDLEAPISNIKQQVEDEFANAFRTMLYSPDPVRKTSSATTTAIGKTGAGTGTTPVRTLVRSH